MSDKIEFTTDEFAEITAGVAIALGAVVLAVMDDPAIDGEAFKQRLLDKLSPAEASPQGAGKAIISRALAEIVGYF